jgi:hypothetical protein
MNRKEMGQLIGSLAARKGDLLVKLAKKDEIIRQQARAIERLKKDVSRMENWAVYGWPN